MIDTETLKKKIIDFAIQGKLTQQLPEDGNAEDLYAKIQKEKDRLLKEGKIKREKALPEISVDEIPFEIPNNWKWVRIGHISSIVSKGTTPRGGNVAYLDSGIGFLRAENLAGYDRLDKTLLKYVDNDTHLGYLKRSALVEGDVLISIAGTLGRTGMVRKDDLPLNTNQAVAFIRLGIKDIISSRYLAYVLNGCTVQKALGNKKVEMAIPNLSLEVISNTIVPLPPFLEQRRIVNIIDEIFTQIDIIDSLQQRYESDLEVLKSKIIDAGIRGKLTEQSPEDGNAEELYVQIQEEKSKLIKEGKIKKEKPLPEISADEIPFSIPYNWKWVRIGQIFTLQAGKNKVSSDIFSKQTSTYKYPCYGGNGLRGYVDDFNVIGRHILIGRQGALCGNIKVADNSFWATEHAVVVYQYCDTDVDFYALALEALNLNKYATSVAQPGLAVSNIEKALVPLPPLGEQRRIASKINTILKLVN